MSSSSLDSYEASLRELALQEKRLRVAIGAPAERSDAMPSAPSSHGALHVSHQSLHSHTRTEHGRRRQHRQSGEDLEVPRAAAAAPKVATELEEDSQVEQLLKQLAEAKRELAVAKAEQRVGRDIGRPGLTLQGLAALEAVAALDVGSGHAPGEQAATIQVTLDLNQGRSGRRWLCPPRRILGPEHPEKKAPGLFTTAEEKEGGLGVGAQARSAGLEAHSDAPADKADLDVGEDMSREEALALLEMTDLDPEEHEVAALKARLAAIEQAADNLEREIDGNKKKFHEAEKLFLEQDTPDINWEGLTAAAAAEARVRPFVLQGETSDPEHGRQGEPGASSPVKRMDKENKSFAVNRALGAVAEDAAAQELAGARALLAEIDSQLNAVCPSEFRPAAGGGQHELQSGHSMPEASGVPTQRHHIHRQRSGGRGQTGAGERRKSGTPGRRRQKRAPWVLGV